MSPVPAMQRAKPGFTLMELLVVLMIIGLLASIAVPIYLNRADKARLQKVDVDFETLSTALHLYKLDNGMLPTTEQGLQALVVKPSRQPVPGHYKDGGYLRELPADPWQHAYQYLVPSRDGTREFEIISLGADGKVGGQDQDADLYY